MTTLEKVIEVLSDISMVDEIRPEMTMDELGMSDYDMYMLFHSFNMELPMSVAPHTTVNDIVNLIESK